MRENVDRSHKLATVAITQRLRKEVAVVVRRRILSKGIAEAEKQKQTCTSSHRPCLCREQKSNAKSEAYDQLFERGHRLTCSIDIRMPFVHKCLEFPTTLQMENG